MSLPAALAQRTLETILERHELTGADDRPLISPMGPVGRVRTWRGARVAKLVYVALTVPPIELDSHMIFAFAPADSAVPHFTLDAVYAGTHHAFHLDLIPRAELGSHLPYMDAVYAPLTDLYTATVDAAGLSRAQVSPRQRALMSPWMLVHRATDEAFAGIDRAVCGYLDHWSELVAKGVPAEIEEGLGDTDLPARDAVVRCNLFSREVDPVWATVSRLLGDEATDGIRAELVGNG